MNMKVNHISFALSTSEIAFQLVDHLGVVELFVKARAIKFVWVPLSQGLENKWKALLTGMIKDINWGAAYQIQKIWLHQHRFIRINCYFLAPAVNLFNDQHSQMQRHIKMPPLEIHFICLGNKEIYCIFKTCCIICV